MSSIVTFYSYKGGVGRSMALANTAVLLARRRKRVLVIDWDLEAPGLERYFGYFKIDARGAGLLNLLVDYRAGKVTDYTKYLWKVQDGEAEFSYLASGKELDEDYSAKLEAFGWQEFFAEGGGGFIESLRERWRAEYDVVLIDSRTGLSDTGGICTIQLPDIVVLMFTPNHQSLYGARDVARLALAARQLLAYDRSRLSVVPLPSRFSSSTELRESEEWLKRSAEAMAEFYEDWIPTWTTPRDIVERLKVPQIDYFGFGEKLAVAEHGTGDPGGLGFVYDRLAALLSNELQGVEDVLALGRNQPPPITGISESDGYEFDLYISYANTALAEEWLRPFIELLREYLNELRGEPIKIFFDYRELNPQTDWSYPLTKAITRSKLILAVLTPTYARSASCLAEWQTFEERDKLNPMADGFSSIVPLLLVGTVDRLPAWAFDRFFERQYLDLRNAFGHGSKSLLQGKPSVEVFDVVRKLAETICDLLDRVPPWKPIASVVTPDMIKAKTPNVGPKSSVV
jgi:MinD-like ATPase involved in chromosome partitioning or flagellar assembly